MSLRSERLLACLSDIGEKKIDEAAEFSRRRREFPWQKWAALAAAVVLVVGAVRFLPRIGSSSGSSGGAAGGTANSPSSNTAAAPSNGASGGSNGPEEATDFLSYAGPILPLALKEADETITAEREVTLDFSAGEWINSAAVADAYLLSNSGPQDRTVSVLYPFVSSLYELEKAQPSLTAEEQSLEAVLHAGGYSGGFQGVDGGAGEQLLNLDQISSWAEYQALLSDGRYQEKALEDYPDLSGVPVIVYKFFDAYGPEPDSGAGYPNPSIRAGFDLDYDKTTVLSYGFHSGRYDREKGTMIQGFSIPQTSKLRDTGPYYLIVVGDDIRNLTTGAYVTGGTDPDTRRLNRAGVSVERYGTDLESALRTAAEQMYGHWDWYGEGECPDLEMCFGLMKDFLLSYGLLSDSGIERYHTGWLEDMDVVNVDRVFYLETRVTVPAGGSVTLTAELVKEGSFDFYPPRAGNEGLYGYDLAATLGSNLTFTRQTVRLEDGDRIEIVRQNLGFDLDGGVREAELTGEHGFLEIRSKENR